MASRAKPKKKQAPIANGDSETSNVPVAVKKSARIRKNVIEEENEEVATLNGNSKQTASAKMKLVPKDASAAKIDSQRKNNLKTTKTAAKKPAAAKKPKAAAKENDIVEAPAEQNVAENVVPSAGKTGANAPKKAVKSKAVAKPKGEAAVKENGLDEPATERNEKEIALPGKTKAKASKKLAEPKAAAKVEPKKAAEAKILGKAAPKVAAKKTRGHNTGSVEASSPQPSTSIKGRQKRENANAIDAIVESPAKKRGKKQTPPTVNDEAVDVKVNAPKRTAFSKKLKNVSKENGSVVDEAIPVETTATKRGKTRKEPVAAEKKIAVVEKKATNKRKPAAKALVKVDLEVEEEGEEEEVVPKKARKKASVDDAKPKTKKAADGEKPKMNATETDYSKINFTSEKNFNMKICSFNVAGLRAFVAKGCHEYFEHEQPNIICLQEIKCLQDEVPAEMKLKNYHPYWFSKPGGRGGVGILSKTLAHHVVYGLDDEEMDHEGRIITAEFEKFYLICVYVPNAGNKLVNLPRRLRWNKLFENHVTNLNRMKPVIIAGDMNVAHTEIDLANPKTNTKNAGFTKEERDGMTDLLSLGFTDAFRYLYPSVQKAYTFWSYRGNARSKNIGWRLDYLITSERLKPSIADCVMRPEVMGSDHCPINLLLNI